MSITGSVGKGGKNSAPDTRMVQGLINPHAIKLGIKPLDVDGLCGPLTISAITRYQTVVMKTPAADGRVEPGGKTFISLTSVPAPVESIIKASRAIAKLTIGNFKKLPVVIDPADGTVQDAYTAFSYDIPDIGSRMVGTQHALGVPNVISITPDASVRIGAVLTPALLAHEQFHYDVGFVVARALAHQLTIAREPTLAALKATFLKLFALHIDKRVGLIQRRYDLDTAHGTNAIYQKIWLDRMKACLANPKANQIGGFWL